MADLSPYLRIAGGSITLERGTDHTIYVATEADAASDDLDSIVGGVNNQVITILPESGARTVVLKHAVGTGLIFCPGGVDLSLADANDVVKLLYFAGQWRVIASSILALSGDATSLAATLASAANGAGASDVGLEDATGSLVAANAEAAIAELATPLTLTVGAEAGDAIAVVVAGPAHVAQYIAKLYDADMLETASAAFVLAETGAGAEVSTTAKASLLFTTSAGGAATIRVTDVAGASGLTKYLEVRPASASAGTKAGPATIVAVTFD